ncbi:hypothetical protein Tco_0551818 [Tanacetum coccineum]
MALNLGPNVERFVSLPKPHVWLYGSASDARGLPLASVSDLAASQHNYVVIIKFARVQGGESRVQMRFNGIDHEVIIIGQTPQSAIFGEGRSIGTKRQRVQLFPTQPWAISFQFPEPVDWKTRRLSHISETVLKIKVEKLSSSLARQAALAEAALMETAIAEEAGSPSVNSTTSVDVNEVGSSGVN